MDVDTHRSTNALAWSPVVSAWVHLGESGRQPTPLSPFLAAGKETEAFPLRNFFGTVSPLGTQKLGWYCEPPREKGSGGSHIQAKGMSLLLH